MSGAFIPGVPAAVAGSNEKVGWGCVPAPADDADLFVETLDADSPKSYWRIDRWKKLEHRQETYLVRGGSQSTKEILISETGPLVSDVAKSRALSVRWTGRDGSNFFSALFKLNRARTGSDVKEAVRLLISPCCNVVWACEDGSFGTQFAGRVPIRASDSDGVVPMPAWTGVTTGRDSSRLTTSRRRRIPIRAMRWQRIPVRAEMIFPCLWARTGVTMRNPTESPTC